MHFDELKLIETSSADDSVDYMIVYHSFENTRLKKLAKGSLVRPKRDGENSTTQFSTIAFPHERIRLAMRQDRLIVTTAMKKRIKNGWGDKILEYAAVKCIYPMVADSPYYEDEELFQAKLSGDYSIVFEKLRTEFMEYKKR